MRRASGVRRCWPASFGWWARHRAQAPIQRLADRVSGIFVPVVVAIAAATFFGTWWIAGDAITGLVNAVAVLVIARGLRARTCDAYRDHRRYWTWRTAGVLIRNAVALESAVRLTTLVVDKTGTVTEGRPGVTNVQALGDLSRNDLLAMAGALEQHALHPLAQAIAAKARSDGLSLPQATAFEAVPGMGAVGQVGESRRPVVVGSLAFLESRRRARCRAHRALARFRRQRRRRRNRRPACRRHHAGGPRASHVDRRDRASGEAVEVVMLSGDNAATVEKVAREVGIAQWRGG